ncbi:MAG TPA: Cro/CI family transcriptional regulator [Verrucomicrobiae bacterium]|nr:Cro/CI family transcriptional regulator [Verrucomicrobiae bacterium]
MRDEPLAKAIQVVGSIAALAAKIGVKPQAVSAWDRVPAERAKAVEAATGVPRHELRPDLWDAP